MPNPLGLSGRQKLVDDALGRVGEISELTFPDDQGVGIRHRVAEFEAQDAKLGQRTVADAVNGLATGKRKSMLTRKTIISTNAQVGKYTRCQSSFC